MSDFLQLVTTNISDNYILEKNDLSHYLWTVCTRN